MFTEKRKKKLKKQKKKKMIKSRYAKRSCFWYMIKKQTCVYKNKWMPLVETIKDKIKHHFYLCKNSRKKARDANISGRSSCSLFANVNPQDAGTKGTSPLIMRWTGTERCRCPTGATERDDCKGWISTERAVSGLYNGWQRRSVRDQGGITWTFPYINRLLLCECTY